MNISPSNIASATDKGRIRENNEDTVAYKIFDKHNAFICIVADGVGGYPGGEIASELAVRSVLHSIETSLNKKSSEQVTTEQYLAFLKAAIENANQNIVLEQDTNEYLSKMATTLVVLLKVAEKIYIAHAGDSRCYCWRKNELKQITKDHTVAQKMLDDNRPETQYFDVSQYHHVLNNGLGLQNKMHIEVHQLVVQQGDVFLLCSDGLSDCLSDENIAAELSINEKLSAASVALVEQANQAGGFDNISLTLCRV